MTITQASLFPAIVPPVTYRSRSPRPAKPRELVCTVLHLGGGVQSSTIAEMIVLGDLPRVDLVVFADTGDEPGWVYAQVEYLEWRLASVEIPLCRVKKPGNGLVADAMAPNGRFASMPLYTIGDDGRVGMLRRGCTDEYKIRPADDLLRDWLLERGHARIVADRLERTYRRVNRHIVTENLYGISWDEVERMSERGPGWQRAIYPLIARGLERQHCVGWLRERGLPVPKKSACRVCPFHDNPYWLDLQRHYPDDFAHACRFDDWLRTPEAARRFTRKLQQPVYLHRSCQPLQEIDFEELLRLPLFGDGVVGACGGHCMT